jgi:conjugal transfer mating pair stabilization protein TraG
MEVSDRGVVANTANSSIDIINYDVRAAIAEAEAGAATSRTPENAFTQALSERVLGGDGLRNRYLDDADAGRGTTQATAPIISYQQSSILGSGRLASDRDHGWGDGDPAFKDLKDR